MTKLFEKCGSELKDALSQVAAFVEPSTVASSDVRVESVSIVPDHKSESGEFEEALVERRVKVSVGLVRMEDGRIVWRAIESFRVPLSST